MFKLLEGKKTYLLGGAACVYAFLGFYIGQLTADEAMKILWAGLTTMSMRAGITKSGEVVPQ